MNFKNEKNWEKTPKMKKLGKVGKVGKNLRKVGKSEFKLKLLKPSRRDSDRDLQLSRRRIMYG